MSLTWETVVAREVGSDRRLPVPERILSILVGEDPPDDARVFWSVAHDDDYLVVSDTPLRKPEYELVTDTTLYTDADSIDRHRSPSAWIHTLCELNSS